MIQLPKVSIASVFIWTGMVLAISFLEAWIKFQAPGITLPLGLGIGRLVFGALNKVELCLSIVTIASLVYYGVNQFRKSHIFFIVPFVILIIQSVWLLPVLDARAELHIQGMDVPPSNLHFYYVAMELVKVVSLLTFGFSLMKGYQLVK